MSHGLFGLFSLFACRHRLIDDDDDDDDDDKGIYNLKPKSKRQAKQCTLDSFYNTFIQY